MSNNQHRIGNKMIAGKKMRDKIIPDTQIDKEKHPIICCFGCKQELTSKETDRYNLENEDVNRDTPYCDKCIERHKKGLGNPTKW